MICAKGIHEVSIFQGGGQKYQMYISVYKRKFDRFRDFVNKNTDGKNNLSMYLANKHFDNNDGKRDIKFNQYIRKQFINS